MYFIGCLRISCEDVACFVCSGALSFNLALRSPINSDYSDHSDCFDCSETSERQSFTFHLSLAVFLGQLV